MPLRVKVPSTYGIDVDYWVIVGWQMDFIRKFGTVEIQGWSSKAKFTAGYSPLKGIPFQFGGDVWPFGDGSGNLMRIAYDYIKAQPPFTTATEEV